MQRSVEREPEYVSQRRQAMRYVGTQWMSSMVLLVIFFTSLHLLECRQSSRTQDSLVEPPSLGSAPPSADPRDFLSADA